MAKKAIKTQNLKPDTVLKDYWRDNSQFADFFNAVLFDGRQVITPDELKEVDTESSTVLEHKEYAESIKASRDNIKICKKSLTHGVEFVMLGLESQNYIDYAMPMRVMGYDYISYKKQYDSNAKKYENSSGVEGDEYLSGMKKTDRFTPVITVVVYYGSNAWDGATTLCEMLDIPDIMKPFVNDYRMFLVEAGRNNLKLHNISNIAFFDLLKLVLDKSMSKNEAKEQVIKYALKHHVDKSVVMTVAGATNSKIDYNLLSKKGEDAMYCLFDEIAKESEEKGMEKGMEKGIQALIESFQELEIPFSKSQKQLMKRYSLTENAAQEYMNKFWK